jgi:hypothetical protein
MVPKMKRHPHRRHFKFTHDCFPSEVVDRDREGFAAGLLPGSCLVSGFVSETLRHLLFFRPALRSFTVRH